MEGKAYVDSLVSDLQSQTLATVVEILQEQNNLNLTSDQKKNLNEGQKHVQFGFRTQIDTFKDQLLSMWHDYKEPQKTIQGVIGEYEGARRQTLEDHHKTEMFHVATARKMGTYYIPSPPPVIPNYESCYKQLGDRFFALSLANGSVCSDVLLNPIDFQLHDIRKCIIIDNHDKTLNVLESTKNILQYGSNVGMPKSKISELLKSMIHEYQPDSYGVFNFINSPLEVFSAVIGMVSYTSRLESIKRAVSRILREPNESIETPVKKYCSLLLTASSMEQPNMSNSEAIDKAHKQAIRAIDFLVEDNTKVQLHRMKQEEYTRMNRKASLKEVMSFVSNIESDPRYQLRTAKGLVGQPVNFSLYHTDTISAIPDRHDHENEESYGKALLNDHHHHSPRIQQHGGSHQHFYGGSHLHGVGSFRPWGISQGRHEFRPQRPHQGSPPPHDDHPHHHTSDQQHYHDNQQYRHTSDPHHHDDDQQNHASDQQHRDQHWDSHQTGNDPRYDDFRAPTPPELQDASYEIYYQHRDGHFSEVQKKSIWVKDIKGNMYCLDNQYNCDKMISLLIRSPSPDMEKNGKKQITFENESANNDHVSKDKEK